MANSYWLHRISHEGEAAYGATSQIPACWNTWMTTSLNRLWRTMGEASGPCGILARWSLATWW